MFDTGSSGTSFGTHHPAVEVEIIEAEVRRVNRRILPPETLKTVDQAGACHVVELAFHCGEHQSLRKVQLLDVGVGGFGVATQAKLEVESDATLYAHCARTGEVLFEEHVLVVNQRSPHHRVSDKLRYTYGLRSLQAKHSNLYKCILDSVFFGHLAQTEGEIEELSFLKPSH